MSLPFSKIGNFSAIISLDRSSNPFTISTLSGTPKTHTSDHLIVSHKAQTLFSVFLLFLSDYDMSKDLSSDNHNILSKPTL